MTCNNLYNIRSCNVHDIMCPFMGDQEAKLLCKSYRDDRIPVIMDTFHYENDITIATFTSPDDTDYTVDVAFMHGIMQTSGYLTISNDIVTFRTHENVAIFEGKLLSSQPSEEQS